MSSSAFKRAKFGLGLLLSLIALYWLRPLSGIRPLLR
jgi:hypothetical protein